MYRNSKDAYNEALDPFCRNVERNVDLISWIIYDYQMSKLTSVITIAILNQLVNQIRNQLVSQTHCLLSKIWMGEMHYG